MKKIGLKTIIGLLATLSLSVNAQKKSKSSAENEFTPKHIIKVFPLDALSGGIAFGYERVIRPKTSLNFEVFQGFGKRSLEDDITTDKSFKSFFEASVRRYISKRKEAPRGWFASGGLLADYNLDSYNRKSDGRKVKDENLWIGVSVRTGYQWIFKKALKGFTTEVFGGVDYRTTTGIFGSGSDHGFAILLNATIGYSW